MIEHIGPLTAELREQLWNGETDPFGVSSMDIEWRAKDLFTLQRGPDGRVIAAVGLVVADVQAGGERFEVVGVGDVMVTHRHRGQGALRPTLDAALERAATLGPARAMLFCSEANAPMYASFGFEPIAAPVQAARWRMPGVAMWRPLKRGVTWPSGPVSLPGLPF